MNQQTRWGSFLESFWNMALGMAVATSVWHWGVRPAIYAGWLSIEDSFVITLIFTLVSLARSFVVRRMSIWVSPRWESFKNRASCVIIWT